MVQSLCLQEKKTDQGENITFLTLQVHWADNSKIIVCRDCIEISLFIIVMIQFVQSLCGCAKPCITNFFKWLCHDLKICLSFFRRKWLINLLRAKKNVFEKLKVKTCIGNGLILRWFEARVGVINIFKCLYIVGILKFCL